MKSHVVKNFLIERLEKNASLLLGLSGGPDSMALLHFLLEVKNELSFSLHLAHIDHGWRKESQKEAEALKALAKRLDLPFHLHHAAKIKGKDLENQARKQRLAFFFELQKKYLFQAVLLAHHQGDQAETVFKRISEGSGIKGLGGIYPERRQGDLLIWRPLLPLSKEDLYNYIKKKRLSFFEDSTNKDPTYLRSRMREALFPQLEKIFGKKMERNFARLGQTFQEISHYLEIRGKSIKKSLISGPFGSYLDLNLDFHPLELKYFFKTISSISANSLDVLMKLIKERRFPRVIQTRPYTFELSQSHLFIYEKPFPNYFENPSLWKKEKEGNWTTFWKGNIRVPDGDYRAIRLSELQILHQKKIKHWYRSNQVPSFFYEKAPVFIQDQEVFSECLTGRTKRSLNNFVMKMEKKNLL